MGGAVSGARPTLGTVLRDLRGRRGWTLKEMSARTGIPVSTLSKVEHDRLTLTYDKLQHLSERLNIRMSELFAEADAATEPNVTARRSVGRVQDALQVETQNYDYRFLNTELRRKLMIPVVTKIRAKSLEAFGALVRHAGEELVYVLEGRIEVHTEFYDPVVLTAGESIYLDSTMGHAYLAAEGCEEATLLGVCSSLEQELVDSLVGRHEGVLRQPRRLSREAVGRPVQQPALPKSSEPDPHRPPAPAGSAVPQGRVDSSTAGTLAS